MPVEPGRGGGGQGQLVAGDVVGVGVGDERPRLPTPDVDRQAGASQEQAVVVVEHGERVEGRETRVEGQTRLYVPLCAPLPASYTT